MNRNPIIMSHEEIKALPVYQETVRKLREEISKNQRSFSEIAFVTAVENGLFYTMDNDIDGHFRSFFLDHRNDIKAKAARSIVTAIESVYADKK